jgi:hypothetical protein
MNRKLVVRREFLAELTSTDLAGVAGAPGTPLCWFSDALCPSVEQCPTLPVYTCVTCAICAATT